MKQELMSKMNEASWNQSAYEAWVHRHGRPQEYAQILKKNPRKAVQDYLKYIQKVEGKKIANLLGSKGNKAVSFALLGADVTVVDISKSNRNYAVELAKHAEVDLEYIVSDVLTIPRDQQLVNFDYVLLELGVLHYFVELQPLFQFVCNALKEGGTFILRDYHPMVSKLMRVEENKMVASGNYFESNIVDEKVAYHFLLSEDEGALLEKQVKLRRWTLGEVVTELSKAGMKIELLEEESGNRWALPVHSPEGAENQLPALYTLIAQK
ncbi:methyltransferase domain-containing protein [Bacillus spongiae]|uniref:Methyltransferase domain-containing protein n=1 Tax=Bacillus spongiae TaxID=2683610 RepID=A0ABU8HK71_9BACI